MANETPRGLTDTHPTYDSYAPLWERVRDCISGEQKIKSENNKHKYLPQLTDQTPDDYRNYLYRAVYVNYTGRIADAMLGALFVQPPEIAKDNQQLYDIVNRTFPNHTPHEAIKYIAKEVITTGRLGVLVDTAVDGGTPFAQMYTAENILDWDTFLDDNGERKYRMVKLKEQELIENELQRDYINIIRVCEIVFPEDGERFYQQTVWRETAPNSGEYTNQGTFPPESRGNLLRDIPFTIVSVRGDTDDITEPPLLAVANLNLKQYLFYADLGYGLHFSGLPTPVLKGVPANDDGTPARVKLGGKAGIQVEADGGAEYMEVTQKFEGLFMAVKECRDDISILGSRILEAPKRISESAENQMIRRSGENSVIINIADSLTSNLTYIINLALKWDNGTLETDEYIEDIVRVIANPNSLPLDPELLLRGLEAVEKRCLSRSSYYELLERSQLTIEGRSWETEQNLIQAELDAEVAAMSRLNPQNVPPTPPEPPQE